MGNKKSRRTTRFAEQKGLASKTKSSASEINRPPLGEIASARISWGAFFNYLFTQLPNTTPDFIREHSGKETWDVYEEMLRDPHISATLKSRKNGILSKPWSILPASDDPRDVEIAKFIEEKIKYIDNFEHKLGHLLKAVPIGYSIAEIIWGEEPGGILIDDLKTRNPERFKFNIDQDLFLVTSQNAMGVQVPDHKFIVHRNEPQDDIPFFHPLLADLYWPWFCKKYAVQFWMIVAEKFGVASIVGKYGPGVGDEDIKKLLQALINLQQDSVATVPKDTEIEPINVQVGERGSFFRELAGFCNDEISKAILGQTLTTQMGDVGSFAATKEHMDVRQDFIESDAKLLMGTIDSTVITWLCLYNFGALQKYPRFFINYIPKRATLDYATTIQMCQSMGLPISKKYLQDVFGIPEPADIADTLAPAPKSAPLFTELPGGNSPFFFRRSPGARPPRPR